MTNKAFILFLAAASGLRAQQPAKPLTAKQVISMIQEHSGVSWDGPTVDTIKAGDPDTPVTGIATTMMATFDVLKRAAAQGDNLIITHEPTFYSHQDSTESLAAANDAVWSDKEKFIAEHHLVVWRFHDHWHERKPDGILSGMTDALLWKTYQQRDAPNLYLLPRTSLHDLAKTIRDRLGIKVLRAVGDPNMAVTKIAFVPGAAGTQRHLEFLRRDDVEVLIIGEVPEWETIEYVSDAAAEGKHKGLILMGHIPSEQAGMSACADWLKTFISGVPIQFVATAEPFFVP